MSEIYRCIEAFAFVDKTRGVPRSLTPGDLMSGDDPAYRGKEHLFEKVEVASARQAGRKPPVEDASADPNEKRSVSTLSKSTSSTASKGATK